MRLRHFPIAATLAVAAISLTAAAPAAEPILLVADALGDTTGSTSPIDTDGRVDITQVWYERTRTVATFSIDIADTSDRQPEDILGAETRGGILFKADDCWIRIGIDGVVDERCNEMKYIGRAQVELDERGYRLTVDLAALDAKAMNHLRPGIEASAIHVRISRGHLNWTDPLPVPGASHDGRGGIGLAGCSFCGGQSDVADDEHAHWIL